MATFNLKKGWIKMTKKELDDLRQRVHKQYITDGGSHKMEDFNTHLPNYEELVSIIGRKLNNFQTKQGNQILIDNNALPNVAPGKTFLKHFFHTKKDDKEAQFQRININLCYLYAFGSTREDLLLKAKEQFVKPVYEKAKGEEEEKKPEFIISFTYNNLNEARKVENFLLENFNLKTTNDIRNSPLFQHGTLKDVFTSLDDNQFVIKILSRDYFQNEECIEGLINFTQNNFELYRKKAINILLPDIYDGEYNIFSTLGKIALSVHWKLHIEKLEKAFSHIIEGNQETTQSEDKMLKEISDKVDRLKMIKKDIFDTLQRLTNMKSTLRYDIFFEKINSDQDLIHLLPRKSIVVTSGIEKIYQSIQVPSNNDPGRPEFPPKPFYTPAFPASETFQIEVPGFTNVWLKDESTNPTGTHKDRFAWEVVIKYKALLESSKYKQLDSLPQISMISSGGAASAVQNLFNLFKIPISLKVLVDNTTDEEVKKSLRMIGCTIYETDLSDYLLQPEDIKRLTENWNGIDITYRETLDPNLDNYYDWMSYEIINQEPDYCFIPFGTGDLFINILNIVKKEYFNSFLHNSDPRFKGSIDRLKNCNFYGATTSNKDTLLDKLYSSFLPTYNEYIKFLNELISYSCVGGKTSIKHLEESFVKQAIELANNQKLTFEPSGIAGLALLLQIKREIPRDAKILIVNTGKTKSAEELLKAASLKQEQIKNIQPV
jgi:cysteine synthase